SDRGVCRYDRSSLRASNVSDHPQSNFARVMLHTTDGETWCGTNRGLFKLTTSDSATGADSWAEVAELQGRSIFALSENDGAVWVGTSGGLFVKPKGASGFFRTPSAPSATITITGPDETEQPPSGETQQPAQDPMASQPDAASTKEKVLA